MVTVSGRVDASAGQEIGGFTRVMRTYPVTASVAMPYALLILPSAILNSNPSLGFIFSIFMIALTTTLLVESFFAFVDIRTTTRIYQEHDYSQSSRFIVRLGVFLVFFGLTASIATAAMGIGTIDSGLGITATNTSALGTVLSLLSGWDIVGTALVIWSRSRNYIGAKSFYFIILMAIGLKLLHVMMLGITVQLWRYLICVFFLLIYFKLMRFRTIIAAMIIVVIAWPIFFELRNTIREDRGVAVSSQVDASDRIRYDIQIARADGVPPGLELGQLDDPIQILRFGLIPRFLDQDRDVVATGRLINQYLGGTSTSSFTFLPVTTSYILGNWYGTIFLYAWWALFAFLLMRNGRRMGPYRVIIFALMLIGPLNWFTVHPDSAIGFLQDIVTAVPIMVFMSFHSHHQTRRTNSSSSRRIS